jgi:DNA-binding GntR family transcriptional regulator
MSAIVTPGEKHTARQLGLAPLNAVSLRDQAYALLKDAIADTDIYSERRPLRLDERQLTQALGVSRTPVREALSILEQEGFVRTMPRRGIFIVRKSKREIIEMIQVWAALEGMSARLATLHAPDSEISKLRHLFDEFENSPPSEAHRRVFGCQHRVSPADHPAGRLAADCRCDQEPVHPRARDPQVTISQDNRAARSIIDHLKIIEALERRDTELSRAPDAPAHARPCRARRTLLRLSRLVPLAARASVRLLWWPGPRDAARNPKRVSPKMRSALVGSVLGVAPMTQAAVPTLEAVCALAELLGKPIEDGSRTQAAVAIAGIGAESAPRPTHPLT